MNDFNYLEEHLNTELESQDKSDALARIATLAEKFLELKEQHKAAEAHAKEIKKELNTISQTMIPEALMGVGLKSVKLTNGKTVEYKEDVSCSIKDMAKFQDFVNDRGDSSIINSTMVMGKLPKEILSKIIVHMAENFGIETRVDMKVHPATLAKYIRELCGINGKTEAEMSLAELDEDMITVFQLNKTTVK